MILSKADIGLVKRFYRAMCMQYKDRRYAANVTSITFGIHYDDLVTLGIIDEY